MKKRTVSISDLYKLSIESLFCEDDLSDIVLNDDLMLDIYIDGESWDGSLDYRFASILTALQKDIFNIYSTVTGEKVTFGSSVSIIDQLKVKVYTEKKCLNIKVIVDIAKVFLKMDKKDIPRVLLSLTAIIGTTALGWKYLDNKGNIDIATIEWNTKKDIAKIESKERIQLALLENKELSQEVEEIVVQSLLTGFKNEEYKQKIAQHINNNDTVEINTIPYTKQELKRQCSDDISSEREDIVYYADSFYEIKTLNFEKNSLGLFIESTNFSAKIDLNPKDKKEISQIFEKATMNEETPKVELQVTLAMENGEIKKATVVGIGEPRKNANNINEIFNTADIRENKYNIKQATLFDK